MNIVLGSAVSIRRAPATPKLDCSTPVGGPPAPASRRILSALWASYMVCPAPRLATGAFGDLEYCNAEEAPLELPGRRMEGGKGFPRRARERPWCVANRGVSAKSRIDERLLTGTVLASEYGTPFETSVTVDKGLHGGFLARHVRIHSAARHNTDTVSATCCMRRQIPSGALLIESRGPGERIRSCPFGKRWQLEHWPVSNPSACFPCWSISLLCKTSTSQAEYHPPQGPWSMNAPPRGSTSRPVT